MGAQPIYSFGNKISYLAPIFENFIAELREFHFFQSGSDLPSAYYHHIRIRWEIQPLQEGAACLDINAYYLAVEAGFDALMSTITHYHTNTSKILYCNLTEGSGIKIRVCNQVCLSKYTEMLDGVHVWWCT